MEYRLYIKRVYGPYSEEDGRRILVDRLWPRGVSREGAGLDMWAKDIAPSKEIRRAFGHDKENFTEFRGAYRGELEANPQAEAFVQKVRSWLQSGKVTLLYGARDEVCNNAVVLKEWILEKCRDGMTAE